MICVILQLPKVELILHLMIEKMNLFKIIKQFVKMDVFLPNMTII